jgi:hypothetical protein
MRLRWGRRRQTCDSCGDGAWSCPACHGTIPGDWPCPDHITADQTRALAVSVVTGHICPDGDS